MPLIFWFAFAATLAAQDDRLIDVVNTDVLWLEKTDGQTVRKLLGNVHFRQDSTDMYCDSAYMYSERNVVEAFSRVRVTIGSGAEIRAKKAVYDGNAKILELHGEVVLTDKRARLETPRLTYRRTEKFGYFTEGGRLSDTANVLTSRRGYYFQSTTLARFKDEVALQGKDFELKTDSLNYLSQTETAYLIAPTDVVTRDGVRVFSDDGRFDTRNKIFFLYPRPVLWDSLYRLRADTLYYDDSTGRGWAKCDVRAAHADSTLFLAGDSAYVLRKQRLVVVTQDPYAVRIGDRDTLELYGDTLKSHRIDEKNYLTAVGNARFATKSLVGRADSLSYSRNDSTFHLVGDPVLWTDTYQLSGDTIRMWVKFAAPDSLVVYPNAFSIEIGPPPFYNQLKARHMSVKFENGAVSRLEGTGNAESIYLVTDGPAYIGLNRSVSRGVVIRFRDNKPEIVKFFGKPEATFSPIHAVWGRENVLESFKLRFDERPQRYFGTP